jgi:hypothetical protein
MGVSRPFGAPKQGGTTCAKSAFAGRCVNRTPVFGDQQDNRVDAIDSVMPWSGIDEIEPSLAIEAADS